MLQGHAVTLTFKLATQILHTLYDTSSQYNDNFCEIVLKSDFKVQSYKPATILLQGHAVTLTFKVATQMLCLTCRLNMAIISVK